MSLQFLDRFLLGLYVSRGQNTSAKFPVTGHSIPGRVVDFTLMGATRMACCLVFIGWLASRFFGGGRSDDVEDLTDWSRKLTGGEAAPGEPAA